MPKAHSLSQRFRGTTALSLALALTSVPTIASAQLRSGASGLTISNVECRNQTTGQVLRDSSGFDEWSCTELGLVVRSGDQIQITTVGRADATGVPLLIPRPFAGDGRHGPWAPADFDADGDTDLGLAEPFSWWENQGGAPPRLIEHLLEGPDDDAKALAAADFDGDRRIDLAASFLDGNDLVWFRNQGGSPPTFALRPIETLMGWWHMAAHAGDLDGDDDNDIVALVLQLPLGLGREELVWFENEGGLFSRSVIDHGRAFANVSSLSLADIDSDGDLDIAFADDGDLQVRWFENDGEPEARFRSHVIDGDFRATHISAADVEGDGDLDIVGGPSLLISGLDQELRIYLNDGARHPDFSVLSLGFFEDAERVALVADLTADGLPEIVLPADDSSSEFSLLVLENLGTSPPVFSSHRMAFPQPKPRDLAAVDLDGDGTNDVLGADDARVDGDTLWYENRQVVGGWLTGAGPSGVRCTNLTRGSSVAAEPADGLWDCEELDLPVETGDRMRMVVTATVE